MTIRKVHLKPLRLNRTKLGEQIGAALQAKVASGELPPGSRLPSERELAELFGVSVPVIRQAAEILIRRNLLHRRQGSGTYVRQDAPDWLSGTARTQGNLGLVIDYTEGSDYFGQLFQQICRAAREARWALQVLYAGGITPEQLRDEILHADVQGILWANGLKSGDAERIEAIDRQKPVVLVNQSPGKTATRSVCSDDYAGAQLAARHLMSLGHKKIAFVTDHLDTSPHRERLCGFRDALRDSKLKLDNERVLNARDYVPDAAEKARFARILPRCSAVFFSSGYLFTHYRGPLTGTGLRVPRDLSLLVYDDFPELERSEPPVTAVRQRLDQIAFKAVEVLGEAARGLKSASPQVLIPPELSERESTSSHKSH
jgi:DNA-binding LacI/PurR family transcriptional regulator